MATDITYPHIEKRHNEPACLARLPRIRVAQIKAGENSKEAADEGSEG